MSADVTTLSDEELDKELQAAMSGKPLPSPTTAAPGQGSADLKKRNQIVAAAANEGVDPSMGMGGGQLTLAGLGGALNELIQGLKEKGQLAFAPEGKEGEALRAKIAANRADRERVKTQLYKNPEAVAGQFIAEAAPAIAAPARIPAQMALEGVKRFIEPGAQTPTGILNELASSTTKGAIGAGTAGVVGKGAQIVGKGINAARGAYTPAGQEALAVDAAAKRLGLEGDAALTVGQLDPTAPISTIERSMPGHPMRVAAQGEVMRDVVSKPIELPEGNVLQVGGKFQDEMKAAIQKRFELGKQKYQDVDQYIQDTGAQGLKLPNAFSTITDTTAPGYARAMDMLERYGIPASSWANISPQMLASSNVKFTGYNDMRVATNKAMNRLDRMLDAPGASAEDKAARDFLRKVKSDMDKDADTWAAKNANNEGAIKLYKNAVTYWRDVVAPTTSDIPLGRTLMSRTKGFATPEDALRRATSTTGSAQLDLLRKTMSPHGEDMSAVLRTIPEVRSATLGETPAPRDSIFALGRQALLHPLAILEAGVPGASASGLAKRLHFAEDPTRGKATWRGMQQALSSDRPVRSGLTYLAETEAAPRASQAGIQYLQGELEPRSRKVVGLK